MILRKQKWLCRCIYVHMYVANDLVIWYPCCNLLTLRYEVRRLKYFCDHCKYLELMISFFIIGLVSLKKSLSGENSLVFIKQDKSLPLVSVWSNLDTYKNVNEAWVNFSTPINVTTMMLMVFTPTLNKYRLIHHLQFRFNRKPRSFYFFSHILYHVLIRSLESIYSDLKIREFPLSHPA